MGSGKPGPTDRPPLITDGGVEGPPGSSAELHAQLTPAEMGSLLDSLEEGVLLLDREGAVIGLTRTVLRDTGYQEPDIVGRTVDSLFEFDEGSDVEYLGSSAEAPRSRMMVRGGLRTVRGEALPATIRMVPREDVLQDAGSILTYRLDNPEAAHTHTRQRRRLGLVNQFNSTLRKVTRSIITSTNREGLESVVCEELAATTPYEIALIAEQQPSGDCTDVNPRAWAGIDDEVVSNLLAPIEPNGETACPITEAISTGTVQVETAIHRNPAIEACFSDANDVGISSVAVVPITYEETIYGVLAVYSPRSGPFEDYEIRMLQELGSIVGFAYNAVNKHELLVTDSIIELAFEITDRDSFFVAASAELDCRIELESVVPRTDDRLLYYHHVTGTDPKPIRDRAAASAYVHDVEVVREAGQESWIVFQLSETSLVEQLATQNVNVRNIVAEAGVVRLTVEMSPIDVVAKASEIIGSVYDEFELVRKRKRDHPALPMREVQKEALDRLTGKQRDTLYAAYESGYFERPRESTAADVAEQLGIGSSTFHQHLREGLRKMVGVMLDSGREEHAPWPE